MCLTRKTAISLLQHSWLHTNQFSIEPVQATYTLDHVYNHEDCNLIPGQFQEFKDDTNFFIYSKCNFGPIDDVTMEFPTSHKLSFWTCFQPNENNFYDLKFSLKESFLGSLISLKAIQKKETIWNNFFHLIRKKWNQIVTYGGEKLL